MQPQARPPFRASRRVGSSGTGAATMTTQATIYARVSTEEQRRGGYSIDAQLDLLREYAAAKGFTVPTEFVEAETAKRAGRKQFAAMVEFLRRRHRTCRAVLIEKTDRWTRNFRDLVDTEDLMERFGLEVHLVRERIVLTRESPPHEKAMIGMNVVMAKYYIDNLRLETIKGMDRKAREGTYPSSAPLGYLNAADGGKKRIVQDPERAPLIRRAFEEYAAGNTSITAVHARAVEAGLTTWSGAPMPRSTLSRLLHSRFYVGRFVWRGQEYPGDHEPLVSLDLFQRTQEAFRRDGKPLFRPKRVWPYAGLVRCAHCGCVLTCEAKKGGRFVYLHCTGGRGPCPKPYVRQERLEELLGELVRGISISPEAVGMIVGAVRDSQKGEREFQGATVARLQAEATRIQTRLDRIYEDRLDGKIDEDLWLRKTEEWRARHGEALAAVERHRDADRLYLDEGARVLHLASRASDLWATAPPEGKRELLNLLLSNSTWDGEILDGCYEKPFCYLAEGRSRLDWYPHGDSNPG
ncbi:MAG: recombinase family protein [Armatimonadetes bacterium]|nr:recombinase family protein [Armatimonadota bacterium]